MPQPVEEREAAKKARTAGRHRSISKRERLIDFYLLCPTDYLLEILEYEKDKFKDSKDRIALIEDIVQRRYIYGDATNK